MALLIGGLASALACKAGHAVVEQWWEDGIPLVIVTLNNTPIAYSSKKKNHNDTKLVVSLNGQGYTNNTNKELIFIEG